MELLIFLKAMVPVVATVGGDLVTSKQKAKENMETYKVVMDQYYKAHEQKGIVPDPTSKGYINHEKQAQKYLQRPTDGIVTTAIKSDAAVRTVETISKGISSIFKSKD